MLLKSIVLIILISTFLICMAIKEKTKYGSWFFVVLAVVYLAVLIWFTLYGRGGSQAPDSYIPFSSYWQIMQVRWYGNGEYIFREIVGNVLLFVPIGVLVTNIEQIRHYYVVSGGIGLVISLAIETAQYVMALGVFEADDIISNVWGAMIGCSLALIIINRKHIKVNDMFRIMLPLFIFVGAMTALCFLPISKEFFLLIKRG